MEVNFSKARDIKCEWRVLRGSNYKGSSVWIFGKLFGKGLNRFLEDSQKKIFLGETGLIQKEGFFCLPTFPKGVKIRI